MFKNTIFRAGLLAAMVTAAHSAGAGMLYSVSSTPIINCGGSPHGLWTNTYSGSTCGQFYNFQDGSTLEVDGTTAVLKATAKNPAGIIATILIEFGGFANTYYPHKEGGGQYNHLTDDPDWDFYSHIISGAISFDNPTEDSFSVLLVEQPVPLPYAASANKPVLQIGKGANDKNGDFGASAWLDAYMLVPAASGAQRDGPAYTGGQHWDLNMSLVEDPPGGSEVPVPGTLALLGLGFEGLGWSRRKLSS